MSTATENLNGVYSLTAENVNDAKCVISEMFGFYAVSLLDKILKNPVLPEGCSTADIAYMNGFPVAFQAVIPRVLYYKQDSFCGIVGSTLCSKPETSPVLLVELMRRSIVPRCQSKMFWSNTACDASVKMNRLLGVRGTGGSTWECVRVARIRTVGRVTEKCRSLMRRVVRKVCGIELSSEAEKVPYVAEESVIFSNRGFCVRRLEELIPKEFDLLWCECLKQNDGLLSSRTYNELNWMFGDCIKAGTDVLIGCYEAKRLAGYVIIRSCPGRRWRIVDMIAQANAPVVIDALLEGCVRYLRSHTKCVEIFSKGFPSSVDGVLGKWLTIRRPARGNTFIWKLQDPDLEQEIGDLVNCGGWFLGPYDGDWCL